jgi:hypothetical protein
MKGHTFLLLLAVTLLAGCAKPAPEVVYQQVKVPYEVKVPTYIKRTPPRELVRPYKPTEMPKFIDPADPSAKVALDEANWQRLQVILRTLMQRDKSWRSWVSDEPENPK